MARKVFISFLGTNNYLECYYKDKDHLSNPVRFVQEALISDICQEWTADDHIYIFCTKGDPEKGTKGSEELNWFDNGQSNAKDDIERIGLETRLNGLKAKGLEVPFDKVNIVEGFSEEEIWSIFDTVYSKLKEEDEIYFDVTHAFRSIPLFSTVLFNYSRFMKNTEIISIKYGAFEKLGPRFVVQQMPLEKRIAPIVDLTNVARLQEYNEMASNLVSFGKTKQLSTILQSTDTDNKILDELSQAVSNLDEYIATNRLSEIREGKFIAKFRCNVKAGAKKQPKPIKEILTKIKSETNDFVSAKDNRNIEAAIKWAKEHEMLAQTYSLAEEYFVLRISESFADLNPFGKGNKSKKQFREFVSLVLGLPEDVIDTKEFHGVLKGQDQIIMELWNNEFIQTIRPEYEKIRKRRNSIIHGNGEFPYHDENTDDLDSDFYQIYNNCIAIINKYTQPCS